MMTLTHFRFCPHSRGIRLALAELGFDPVLVEERPWEWRSAFLARNPSGELPVLEIDGGTMIFGDYAISEYLADEIHAHPVDGLEVPLFPGDSEDRSEIRRLVAWFNGKLDREVTQDLLNEKIVPRFQQELAHTPDLDVLRAARTNLAYHMSYIDHLAGQRKWLGGDVMSYADLAAAAHISCADYLDEIQWSASPAAKVWYARMKSRRSMRAVLADRIPGLHPTLAYTSPDF